MRKIQPENLEVSKLQDNTEAEFIRILTSYPLLTGRLVTVNLSDSGNNYVEHGLKREVQGFINCGTNNYGQIYKSSDPNPRPKDQIILLSEKAVTATLYIF
jgi:hypothetical protein